MKVAIVHDWLTSFGGAERVVLSFLEMFPEAQVFTLVYNKKNMQKYFSDVVVHTSFLQKIPFATKLYTKMLPLMPRAIEGFDLTGFDLVISSSSCVAKGVITPPECFHIAYIHSPMRYAWDLYFEYKKESGSLTRFFMPFFVPALRLWDFASGARPNLLVCNSFYIAKRIKKFWGRDSCVLFPPIDIPRIELQEQKQDYYVAFSRFVPYKRLDLAIKACIKLNKKLFVIGTGPQEKYLKTLAKGNKLVTFLGALGDKQVQEYLKNAKALIFCAKEDFGMIPVEAQSCGCPVIAFGAGGAKESIKENKTGVFFARQSVESLVDAIQDFEKKCTQGLFVAKKIRQNALLFSKQNFIDKFQEILNTHIN